jgi:NADH:ubiquinone oxidoreductase subunit F (NADH-binding)
VYVKESSLCGLGGSAPNPLLSTLRHFRHEYENRIITQEQLTEKLESANVEL